MTELGRALFLWINLSPSTPAWLVRVVEMASQQWLPYLVVATITVLLLGRTPWRDRALRTLLAVAVAAAASRLLKHGLAMPRPAELGAQWLPHSRDGGIPSSHATVAAAWAVTAAMVPVRLWWRVLFVAMALVVGGSRIALGLHFPLDVAAGWALGTAVALGVKFIANAVAKQRALDDAAVLQESKTRDAIEP